MIKSWLIQTRIQLAFPLMLLPVSPISFSLVKICPFSISCPLSFSPCDDSCPSASSSVLTAVLFLAVFAHSLLHLLLVVLLETFLPLFHGLYFTNKRSVCGEFCGQVCREGITLWSRKLLVSSFLVNKYLKMYIHVQSHKRVFFNDF